MIPARGLLLVKPVQTEETLAGGKIILVQEAREAMAQYQCEVVAVGPPEICEAKHCERDHHTFRHTTFGSIDGKVPGEVFAEEREHPIPTALCVGAWVLVRPRSFTAASETEDLYFVRQADVEAVFEVTD